MKNIIIYSSTSRRINLLLYWQIFGWQRRFCAIGEKIFFFFGNWRKKSHSVHNNKLTKEPKKLIGLLAINPKTFKCIFCKSAVYWDESAGKWEIFVSTSMTYGRLKCMHVLNDLNVMHNWQLNIPLTLHKIKYANVMS